MKYFKLKFINDDYQEDFKIVKGKNVLEIIKKYNLCEKKHINTRIMELEGEQLGIAIANED